MNTRLPVLCLECPMCGYFFLHFINPCLVMTVSGARSCPWLQAWASLSELEKIFPWLGNLDADRQARQSPVIYSSIRYSYDNLPFLRQSWFIVGTAACARAVARFCRSTQDTCIVKLFASLFSRSSVMDSSIGHNLQYYIFLFSLDNLARSRRPAVRGQKSVIVNSEGSDGRLRPDQCV